MSERELDEWLAEHLFGLPVHQWVQTGNLSPFNPVYGCTVEPAHGMKCYPANEGIHRTSYCSTGNGMLLVLEAMALRGLSCGMLFSDNGAQHVAMFYDIGARPYSPLHILHNLHAEHETGSGAGNLPLPHAVAEAAKLALLVAAPEEQAK